MMTLGNLLGGLASFVLLISVARARKDPSTTPLNEWPMIMAHDAATTYLHPGLVNNWAKTQADGGAKGILDCGGRGFDWRPKLLANGTLVMHHAAVTVEHAMGAALDEMVGWAAQHNPDGSADDLVVIGITDCDGGAACTAAAQKELSARNITYVTDCAELKGLTAAAAAKKGALPGGGALLATFDCWVMNYEPRVACSGFGTKAAADLDSPDSVSYSCYNTSKTKAFPLDRMWQYLANVSTAGPPQNGELYTAQALWQETDASVVLGELAGSSLLGDESRAQLNAQLAARIAGGQWDASRLNFVEVNNVCDGGPGLLAALRTIGDDDGRDASR